MYCIGMYLFMAVSWLKLAYPGPHGGVHSGVHGASRAMFVAYINTCHLPCMLIGMCAH